MRKVTTETPKQISIAELPATCFLGLEFNVENRGKSKVFTVSEVVQSNFVHSVRLINNCCVTNHDNKSFPNLSELIKFYEQQINGNVDAYVFDTFTDLSKWLMS